MTAKARIFTIGHSNREWPEFLDLLRKNGIDLLVDVRKLPRSRANPQYNAETIAKALEKTGIGYTHLESLTGFRKGTQLTVESAWENKSFKAYAAYMRSPEFKAGLDELLRLSAGRSVAIMCSEAVWWRCHRRMIADALIARGYEVRDILSEKAPLPHQLTTIGHVQDGEVFY